ncbi:hypothetical protein HMPREF9057_00053 [Actinomyces sp. oral taxon 171 str. F0337]|nr:hypothetical protein HMPREF9057_00053 [Actinomyces sp. oral taxon 171 str. F0337]
MSSRFVWAASMELPRELLVAVACGSKMNDDRVSVNRTYFPKNRRGFGGLCG